MGNFDKYFITEAIQKQSAFDKKYPKPGIRHLFSFTSEEDARVPGAFQMETQVVVNTTTLEKANARPHCHDFDEYMVFASIDPQDVSNLGGEIEFWMEDEKHIITKSTAVFIPKFIMHLPMNIKRVDRPFMWISTATTLKYSHFQYSKNPKHFNGSVMDEIAEVTLGGKKYQVTKSYLDYLEYLMERNRKGFGL